MIQHHEANAAAFEGEHEIVAQILVEATQHLLAAMEQDGLGAEACEDRRELDGDIAAAHDDDAARQTVEVKDLVGGDDVLGALQIGIDHGMPAGRNQDHARRHTRAVVQAHAVRPIEHGARPHDGDAAQVEIAFVGALEAVDLAILVGDQRRPVEFRFGAEAPAIARASSKSSPKRDA